MNLMAIELAQKGINWRANMHRLTWSASLVALAFIPIEGYALGLGRVNVLSALGAPLKAEIDITAISPAEASSLKAKVASQEVYRSAGIDFNQVLSNVTITLEQRSSGKQYLRITSNSAVTEPFIDAILDIKWSSGQLVREYTMLFDPPEMVSSSTRLQNTPPPAVTPVAMDAPPPRSPSPAPSAVSPASNDESDVLADAGDDDALDAVDEAPPAKPVQAAAPKPAQPVTQKKAAPETVAATPKAEPKAAPAKKPNVEAKPVPVEAKNQAPAATVKTIAVKPGDTLSSLAEKHRTEGVSLDQMIVGLYRNNTNAFIGENMNRMKAGVVLKVPAAETSQQNSPADARRIIVAQSADFEAFRERLAGATTTRVPAVAKQQVTGTVEAEVKDQQAIQAAAPNKLTLSKGGMKSSEADSIAASRAEAEATARVEELSRTKDELDKLKEQIIQAKPKENTDSSGPLVANSETLADPVKSDEDLSDLAIADGNDSVIEATELEPVQAEPAPVPAPAPVQVAEPEPAGPTLAERFDSLKRQFHVNPGVIAGVAAVLALLGAGFLFWRSRRKSDVSETSFLESRLQPDSFFGASGGQRVDTRDAAGPSSMSYSLSQLDAIGDVDPLAEADVYLAYGRDLQAEEILKEALRSTPERLPIHTKLMEVYAKRRDSKGVEQVAKGLLALTNGEGPDWLRAKELGLSVDPGNPLYKSVAPIAIADDSGGVVQESPAVDQTAPFARSISQPSEPVVSAKSDADDSAFGDIDLDISLPPTPEMLGQDASEPVALPELRHPEQAVAEAKASEESEGLDFEFDIDATLPPVSSAKSSPPPEFDLSSISLDLDDEPAEEVSESEPLLPVADTLPAALDSRAPLTAEMVSDPMQRKLELAQEFMQIGDADGARELLAEVTAEGKPETIAKARQLLDKLS